MVSGVLPLPFIPPMLCSCLEASHGPALSLGGRVDLLVNRQAFLSAATAFLTALLAEQAQPAAEAFRLG
jgi:hypothetical protein